MKPYDPYEDENCIQAFIESNYEDFEETMNERGIYHDYYCDHEFDYCESKEEKFLEFAEKFHAAFLESQEEHKREVREDR